MPNGMLEDEDALPTEEEVRKTFGGPYEGPERDATPEEVKAAFSVLDQEVDCVKEQISKLTQERDKEHGAVLQAIELLGHWMDGQDPHSALAHTTNEFIIGTNRAGTSEVQTLKAQLKWHNEEHQKLTDRVRELELWKEQHERLVSDQEQETEVQSGG